MLTAHLWREPGAIRPLTRGAEAGSIDSAPIRIGWYVRMQACCLRLRESHGTAR